MASKVTHEAFLSKGFYLTLESQAFNLYDNKDGFRIAYDLSANKAAIREVQGQRLVIGDLDLRTESDLDAIISMCVYESKRELTKDVLASLGFAFDYELNVPIRIICNEPRVNPKGRFILKETALKEVYFHHKYFECLFDVKSSVLKIGRRYARTKNELIAIINEK